MAVTKASCFLGVLFLVFVAYEIGIVSGMTNLQICISISPDRACELNCTGNRENCSQACSRDICTMYCSNDTWDCKQICGRPSCRYSECYAQEKCNQICKDADCPTLNCYSPGKCDFEVQSPGGLHNSFACHHPDAECNVDCLDSANCSVLSHSANGSIICRGGNCSIDFRHEYAANTVTCVSGATCHYLVHPTASVSCSGQCAKRLHATQPNVTATPPTTTAPPTTTTPPTNTTGSGGAQRNTIQSFTLFAIVITGWWMSWI